jgi:hypothetical protein
MVNQANSCMYLWESVKVTEGLHNFGARAMQDYQGSIAEWAPVGVERGMTLVATWGVCGVVGPYPWCLNLWEYPAGWQGLAQMNNAQFRSPGASQSTIDLDAKLVDWFARANKLRTFVYDRMLAPSSQTPTLGELLKAKVSGNAYYHEIVKLAPGRAEEYQQRLHAEWQPAAERLGMQLIGCYKTELRNDSEAVNLWALRDFAHWAELEEKLRSDADARRWVASTEGLVDDWQTWLLMPYSKSPLQTGQLP